MPPATDDLVTAVRLSGGASMAAPKMPPSESPRPAELVGRDSLTGPLPKIPPSIELLL